MLSLLPSTSNTQHRNKGIPYVKRRVITCCRGHTLAWTWYKPRDSSDHMSHPSNSPWPTATAVNCVFEVLGSNSSTFWVNDLLTWLGIPSYPLQELKHFKNQPSAVSSKLNHRNLQINIDKVYSILQCQLIPQDTCSNFKIGTFLQCNGRKEHVKYACNAVHRFTIWHYKRIPHATSSHYVVTVRKDQKGWNIPTSMSLHFIVKNVFTLLSCCGI